MRRKRLIIILSIAIILIAILFFVNMKTGNALGQNNRPSASGEQISVTRDTLPLYMKQLEIVKDLPKKGVIGLNFYDFSNGQRIVTHKYVLTQGGAELKNYENEDLDLIISLHTKYFPQLGDFCKAVKNANNNGDLGIDLKISKTSFLWKYKGMMGYKNCLGF